MAKLLVGQTIGEVWIKLIKLLITSGESVVSRRMETRELLNVTIMVEEGLNNIIVSSPRDLNYRFMIAEWLWIAAGFNKVDLLTKYNPVMQGFSDDGEILSGAYGPRLYPQWPYLVETLGKPGSRQAVATIWTPSPKDSKDIPCTISIQFFIRENLLHLTVNMRSSDVWLGIPYDFFTFSQLANVLSMDVEKRVGSVTFNLGSSHLYKVNIENAYTVAATSVETISSPSLLASRFPSDIRILQTLEQTNPKLDWPWSRYADALKQNKKHALEVLRELSPK